jgi:hypothetical protein
MPPEEVLEAFKPEKGAARLATWVLRDVRYY